MNENEKKLEKKLDRQAALLDSYSNEDFDNDEFIENQGIIMDDQSDIISGAMDLLVEVIENELME